MVIANSWSQDWLARTRRILFLVIMQGILAEVIWPVGIFASDQVPPVAIVQPVIDNVQDPRGFALRVQQSLANVGVTYNLIRETDLCSVNLNVYRVIVLPYATKLSSESTNTIINFIHNGGKVIVFFGVPDALATALGLGSCSYIDDNNEGRYYSIQLNHRAVRELPSEVIQNSWIAVKTKPLGNTRVIGYWVNSDGRHTNMPAAFLSENGVMVGHVFTMDDTETKSLMLLALIGHFFPEQWERSYAVLVNQQGNVGGVLTKINAERVLISRERYKRAERAYRQATGMCSRATLLAKKGDYCRAVTLLLEGRKRLQQSLYPLVTDGPQGELRGVFIARPWNVGNWERLARDLKRSGINAVFPYFGSAGIAHYRSRLLPLAPEVLAGRDPLQECIKGCRRYGIQVHVWRNMLHLEDADPQVQHEFDVKERVVRRSDGMGLPKLCPTCASNRYYEQQIVQELIQNYSVSGVNLDYARYPNWPPDYCYCRECRQRFEVDEGVRADPWPQAVITGALKERYHAWGRKQITAAIRTIRNGIAPDKNWCVLSADVFGWPGTRTAVGQDLEAWLSQHLVDFVCFMDYTLDQNFLASLVQTQVKEVQLRCPVTIGLGAFSHVGVFQSPDVLLDQVRIVRDKRAEGFIIYQYNELLRREFMPALGAGATSSWSLPHFAAQASVQ